MQGFNIVKKSEVKDSFRNSRVFGMFDIPKSSEIDFILKGEIELDFNWSVGLITGPSGSGKSSLAHHLFEVTPMPEWDNSKSIVDNFREDIKVDEIIGTLQGVGLSSPKTYIIPYSHLSNGQKFRADLARVITENDVIVYDEFTSVVDRTVAKAACVSVAKTIKRTNKKFIAVTCHNDVEEWLEPDWKYDTGLSEFRRDCLRRPKIQVKITKGSTSFWGMFHKHHYLSASISPSAQVYLTWVKFSDAWTLVGFFSTMPAMGMTGWVRGHRTVVLPDFQGLGIGNKMIELVAQWLWKTRKIRFRATTSSPQIVKYRIKRPFKWRLVDGVEAKRPSGNKTQNVKTSAGRLTTTWEYIPQQEETKL